MREIRECLSGPDPIWGQVWDEVAAGRLAGFNPCNKAHDRLAEQVEEECVRLIAPFWTSGMSAQKVLDILMHRSRTRRRR